MDTPAIENPANAAATKRGRRTMLLILAVCAAPLVASYAAFYFWRPDSHTNYGELIEPQLLPDSALAGLDGKPFRFSQVKGEWVLLVAAPAACDEACRRDLVYIRQVRLASGRETERIERVWIVTDGAQPDAALLAEHAGLRVARDPKREIVQALPGAAAGHIYVVDPLGHLMMRFPADPDPKRMLKDVSRLLRHSKWK